MQNLNTTEFPSTSDDRFYRDINVQYVTQFLIGGFCGVVAGRIYRSRSKIAALAFSSGFSLFHILYHKGYITLDKDQVIKDFEKDWNNWKEILSVENLTSSFGEDCKFAALGFSGGFILGMK